MSLELLGRVHKELAITGSAFHEAILAIAERVNRKVQIIRLHWQASTLLHQMDHATAEVGLQLVDHLSHRRSAQEQPEPLPSSLDTALHRAMIRVRECKQALVHIDAQIRDLRLESIHHDLLRLQRDLSLRSAAIERVTIAHGAAAIGQRVADSPHSSSVHLATILRGPFLLAPTDDLVFRTDDIVVLVGLQSEMDQFVSWLTGQRPQQTASPKSA